MGNWNTSQITQLDQVIQPTDSVQALSESLLSLSKHFVNRIDIIWFHFTYTQEKKDSFQ